MANMTKKTPSADANDAQVRSRAFRRQAIFWTLAFAAFLGFLVLFRHILLPFAAGMVLAYFLDPIADRLQAWKIPRALAAFACLFVFLIFFVLALVLVAPIISQQFAGFIDNLPSYIARLRNLAENYVSLSGIGASSDYDLDALIAKAGEWSGAVLASLWSSGKALFNLLALLVITPIVAFYMLVDWDVMVERIDSWLPRAHRQTVRALCRDMDKAIAAFVRGQGSICLILGLYYGIALSICGLNFGLLIGLFAGLISFIPFIGSLIGLFLALAIGLVQFWPDYVSILMIAGIFAFGQFIEGNFLQPRIVGRRIGLHPVWLMFSLSAFGTLLGFTGLLIAVPLAAALGVLARFALNLYLKSAFYEGAKKSGDSGAKKNADSGAKRKAKE